MKKYLLIILAIGLLLALTSCEEFWEALAEVLIEPYVQIEDEAGEPLEGVTVELINSALAVASSETSSATGYVGFGTIDEGTYTLKATKTDYITYERSVGISSIAQFLGVIIMYEKGITVSGTVINAKIDADDLSVGETNGIGGATVTLLEGDTSAGTATSGSDGTFSFNAVEPGTYTVQAVLTDYAFIDEDIEVLDEDLDMGDLLGFSAPNATDISIIVTWSDDYDDVDAHLTYPDAYKPDGTPKSPPVLIDPYTVGVTGVADGFEANTTTGREHILYENKTSVNTLGDIGWEVDEVSGITADDLLLKAVNLDVDDTDGSGPETVTIKVIPFDYITALNDMGLDAATDFYTTLGSTLNALDPDMAAGGDDAYFGWVGVMEFYVDGFNADNSDATVSDNLMTEGEAGGADVTVYITQGTEVKGRYIIPDYTTVKTAAVIRINMLLIMPEDDSQDYVDEYPLELFQIVPDIRVFQSANAIKGKDSSGILTLTGRSRG